MRVLEGRGLRVVRGGIRLLDDVDIGVQAGRITSILGANGAGKSTLLRVLIGDLTPDCGDVELLGRALPAWSRRQLAQVRAVLPQHAQLAFGFDVRAIVQMGRMPYTESRSVRDRKVDEALDTVGLSGLAHRDWRTLSGGERQRVRLARVLCQLAGVERGVVLLDEPTNHLDLSHQGTVVEVMRLLADQGLAVVAVLHDLRVARIASDDAVLLVGGRVIEQGDAGSVMGQHALERVYGVPFHPAGPADGWMPQLVGCRIHAGH